MTTQQGIQIFKWLAILIVAILLFMLGRGCGKGVTPTKSNDTLVHKIDTVYIDTTTEISYVPKPYKVTEYDTTYSTDTLEWTEYLPVDTANILKDYLATRYYHDSAEVKYGIVYIDDTITRNKIKGRGLKTSFHIPIVKETITLTRPRRNIAYIGFGAMGSEQSFLEQTEISFGFKVKNDKYYGIKGAMSRAGNVLAGIEFKIPIRLKNKN